MSVDSGTKQVNQILLNSSGIGIYTATTGTRMQLTNGGLELWNGNTQTVGINASNGSAFFKGDITGSSGTFGGVTISSTGLSASQFSIDSSGNATFSGNLNAAGGSFSGTLQGNTYRTANTSTYPRIAINDSYNQITFETVSGHNPGSMYGYSAGSYGILRIGSPYASGYTEAYITMYSLGSSLSYIALNADVASVSGGMVLYGGGIDASATGTSYFNKVNIGSTVYANTLGTGTGLNIVQVQSGTNAGYLKVSTSSIKYKTNLEYLNDSNYLNIIDDIKPVLFNYKEQPDDPKIMGLIAEDLVQVQGMENFVVSDSEGEPLGINYDRISVALIMALKEIKQRLENIEQRLDALEA